MRVLCRCHLKLTSGMEVLKTTAGTVRYMQQKQNLANLKLTYLYAESQAKRNHGPSAFFSNAHHL